MMRIKLVSFLAFFLVCNFETFAQQKVTLEDVFKNNTFSQKSVQGINWMKDGQFYSKLQRGQAGTKVVKVNVATGEETAILIDGEALGVNFSTYSFNADE